MKLTLVHRHKYNNVHPSFKIKYFLSNINGFSYYNEIHYILFIMITLTYLKLMYFDFKESLLLNPIYVPQPKLLSPTFTGFKFMCIWMIRVLNLPFLRQLNLVILLRNHLSSLEIVINFLQDEVLKFHTSYLSSTTRCSFSIDYFLLFLSLFL